MKKPSLVMAAAAIAASISAAQAESSAVAIPFEGSTALKCYNEQMRNAQPFSSLGSVTGLPVFPNSRLSLSAECRDFFGPAPRALVETGPSSKIACAAMNILAEGNPPLKTALLAQAVRAFTTDRHAQERLMATVQLDEQTGGTLGRSLLKMRCDSL